MVGRDAQSMEWTPNSPTNPRPHHRDGCVTPGLGCSIRADEYRQSLVGRREGTAHRCVGASGWSSGNKTFTKGRENLHVYLRMDNMTAITYINQMGGTRSQTLSQEACNLWHWCLQQGITLSAEHLPGTENTVADIESRTLQSGEEWMLDRFTCHRILQILGPCSVDLFASRLNNQVHQLAPRPIRNSDKCLLVVMAGRNWVCISPVCNDPANACRRYARCTVVLVIPVWVTQPWYPTLQDLLVEYLLLLPAHKRLLCDPFNRVGEQPTPISHLESLRKCHTAANHSERASELIVSGWSKGTNTAYQSGWNKWASWCGTRKINPISGDVKPFVDFLADLYEQGLQHRSINTIRLAVSMTHAQVDGTPIRQHPLVTRLLKGVYNKRPPMPQYSSTWDVDIVTDILPPWVGMKASR